MKVERERERKGGTVLDQLDSVGTAGVEVSRQGGARLRPSGREWQECTKLIEEWGYGGVSGMEEGMEEVGGGRGTILEYVGMG